MVTPLTRDVVRAWTKEKLSFDSGYYAGRPASPDDLNSEILEYIHAGIVRDVGTEAAKNFTRMVNRLENFSASAFIVALERFAHAGYGPEPIPQEVGDSARLTAHGDAMVTQALWAVASAFGRGPGTDDNPEYSRAVIAGDFLHHHRREIPEEEWRAYTANEGRAAFIYRQGKYQ